MVDSNVAECSNCGRLVNSSVNRRCPNCETEIREPLTTVERKS